jgi:hypothetical protein
MRMDLGKIEWEVVDWLHLTQGRDRWWTLMNRVMNLVVHKSHRIS